jgi:dipeptidyl aminopeptidase/acylaminoacyl peptidase
MIRRRRIASILFILALIISAGEAQAQQHFTIEQILAPAYPYDLTAAKKVDRLVWVGNEQGKRNVYTAVGPDYKPVAVTAFTQDDGVDLQSLQVSDDGALVAFIRGHSKNRNGWVANPANDIHGVERAVWAARTSGGTPWKVVVADDFQLSPDGQWVAYEKDGQIYRVPMQLDRAKSDVDKGQTPLVKAWGTNRGPLWSPDGKKLAFTSDRGDHSFIVVYDSDTQKITYIAPGVDRDGNPSWSLDSKQIAFIRRPGLPFGQQQGTAMGNAAPNGGVPGQRGGGGGQRGQGQRGGGGDAGAQRGEGRPGLTNSAFSSGYSLSLWVADVATGKGKEIWHNTTGGQGFTNISALHWGPTHLTFQAEPKNWRHYYSVPLAGSNGDPQELTPGEGEAEFVGFSNDGKTLFFSTNVSDIDRRHIWKVPTAGGTPTQLTNGSDIETYPVAMAGEKFACLVAGPKQPQSVAVVANSEARPRMIFPSLKNFPTDQLVVPENVELTAADGMKIHTQVFLPKDLKAGEKRPAILFTHGGPARQMLLGFHYMDFYHMFYAMNQYFTNQGYIVISVNYRGGIGYGASFRNAPNRGQAGNSEYQDLEAAGHYLQNRPDVDTQRIGLYGLSYGGLMTAEGLARNSDIFAAGVDLAGVHLWGNSIDPNAVSYQSSAISAIDKWKSPVLLIQGDDDRNVPFSETTGLVQLLRAHNIPHDLIVFPDEVHEYLVFDHWRTAFNATDEFFKRYLRAHNSNQN